MTAFASCARMPTGACCRRTATTMFALSARHLMLQDPTQIAVYEDKSAQVALWAEWMPDTWRFTDEAAAMALLAGATYPLVSKADVGASSTNVRILETRAQAEQHVREVFGPGVSVHHGAHCPRTKQHGYVLLQRFIPHTITYRVQRHRRRPGHLLPLLLPGSAGGADGKRGAGFRAHAGAGIAA